MGALRQPDGGTDGDGDADTDNDSDSDGDGSPDADDPGCPAGQVTCDGECAALETDPDNCGACGSVCPDQPHADGVCEGSTCALACDPDWGDCDGSVETGCEANLTSDESNCGGCGFSCPTPPNAIARCSGGRCTSMCATGFVDLEGRCAAFGGAYVALDCGGFVCRSPNAFTGACSCPAGFVTTEPEMRIVNDCSATESRYTMASLRFCSAPERAGAADWAGAYHLNDPASGGCHNANPYTGACSCPPGVRSIELRAERDGFQRTVVGVCLDESAPTVTFAGAYEATDAGGCLVAHPATGGCSCPAGSTALGLRAIARYRWPGGGTGDWGATIALCVVQY
jgi:hypothetical protein